MGCIGATMNTPDPVSLKEAQFILGRSEKEINRAIDRDKIDKVIEEVMELAPALKKKKRKARALRGRRRRQVQRPYGREAPRMVVRKVRKIGGPELLFLMVEKDLHAHLSPAGRHQLYEAIKVMGFKSGKVTFGQIEVPLKSAFNTVNERYRELQDLRNTVVEEPGKDPVVAGSGVSVYVLSALAVGQTVEEVLDDYPGLTREQFNRALTYAAAYPKKGRAYPSRSFKRMIGDLASSGVFDAPEPDEPLTLDMVR